MAMEASKISFAAITGVLMLGLGACATEESQEAGDSPQNPASTPTITENSVTEYVALGDSYAAMGSISAPAEDQAVCLRSTDNYPAVVLAGLQVESGTDVSCAGATMPDLLLSLIHI